MNQEEYKEMTGIKRIAACLMAACTTAASVTGCMVTSVDDQDLKDTTGASQESPEETLEIPEISTVEIAENEALLVGADGLSGVFNPLFADSEADRKVCDLIFDTICEVGELGELEEGAGMLTPVEDTESSSSGEESEDGSADAKKTFDYQLTLQKGLTFSDGTEVTIDDVIFTWKVMSDPFYEGSYSLASVPVVGIQEYYYDTDNVAKYKKKLNKNYSNSQISEEDFIAYLIDTGLNGWFDGKLPGNLDGKGTTWVDYLQSNGYDTTGIEEDAEKILALLAKCEYENYSFTYDPYSYYKEKAHDDILKGGAEITEISGISKTDAYTCTISFKRAEEEDLRALTDVPILSAKYYGGFYEKGNMEKLAKLNSAPMGSGLYTFNGSTEEQASLIASTTSREKSAAPYVLIKNVAEADKAQALEEGRIGMASLSDKDRIRMGNNLQAAGVTGNGFYYLGINTDLVNKPTLREGIMSLVDKSLLTADEETIMQILKDNQAGEGQEDEGQSDEEQQDDDQTDGGQGEADQKAESGKGSDDSDGVRVVNLVPLSAQSWPMSRLSVYYPGIDELMAEKTEDGLQEVEKHVYDRETALSKFSSMGYWNDGVNGLVKNGEVYKLNIGISEELPDRLKAIAYRLKEGMESIGAEVKLKEYSAADMEAIIPTAALDIWIGSYVDIPYYNMEDYLKYRAKYNYFHHGNDYGDLLFKTIKEDTVFENRKDNIREMLGYIEEGSYIRPLCAEVAEVYVVNTDMVSGQKNVTLNEYDHFSEIVQNAGVK